MKREEMVSELVEKITNDIIDCGAAEWIENRLRYGMPFKPYDKMTDEEIEQEYRETFPQEDASIELQAEAEWRYEQTLDR
jgi:hypothetical protein